jgi:hypothetical protein
MLRGVYRPVVELLRDAGLQGSPARNLCAAALGGRLDPATIAGTRLVFIEDELPWFRLDRLLRTFKRGGFAPDDLRDRDKVERLCVAAGVPPPSEALRAAAGQPLLGAGANWDPVNRSGLTSDDATALLKWVEDARMDLIRGFGSSFLAQAVAWETGQLVSLDLPHLPVLYDDAAVILPQSTADDGLARELTRWCARLIAEYTIAFIQGRPVTSPSTMARKVRAGLILAGVEADAASEMARKLFLGGLHGAGTPSLVGLCTPDIVLKSLTVISDE